MSTSKTEQPPPIALQPDHHPRRPIDGVNMREESPVHAVEGIAEFLRRRLFSRVSEPMQRVCQGRRMLDGGVGALAEVGGHLDVDGINRSQIDHWQWV